jgi:Mpv17-like protein
LYGTLLQAPALYCWMRVAQFMWPRRDIRSSLAKALTEQVAFDPFSISIFLYSMTIFEGKKHDDAKKEVSRKPLHRFAERWPNSFFNQLFIKKFGLNK